MPQRQANVRLDDVLFERLEVLAFVHRRSFAEEMRAALLEWAKQADTDQRVKAVSVLRDPLPEDEEAQVTSLTDERKKRDA